MTVAVPKTLSAKLDLIIALLAQQLASSKERPNSRRLLRVAEAAKYLHVSPWTLRGLVQRGELPIVRLGENGHSPWLFDLHDLDQWIAQRKVTL